MKYRKIIATVLCAGILCGVAACNKKDDEEKKSSSETNIESEADKNSEKTSDETKAETSEDVTPTSPSEIPDAYKDVLDEVRTIMTSGGAVADDEFPMEKVGLYEICMSYDPSYVNSHIGYSLVDLDGDGSDELIIGCVADTDLASEDSPIGRAGYMLLDLYTLDGDNAVLIADAWGRNSWFITADKKLANWGSSGAAFANFDVYDMSNGCINMDCAYSLYSDYDFDTDVVSFYERDAQGNISVVCTDDDGWTYFDEQVDSYLEELLPVVLLPVNSL